MHTQSTHPCSRRHVLRLTAGGIGVALVGSRLPRFRHGIASAASGKISVYSAFNESTNNAFVAAFKKSAPGLNVELLPLAAAGELQTRIRTEKDAPTMAYLQKLHANIGQYTGTAPQAIQLVGQGQCIGAPHWSHDILTAQSQGQPLANRTPQPTGFEVGAVSMIKGGPNPDGAKAFVDWVLRKAAGALHGKLANRLSVRKDVAPAPGAPTLDTVRLVPYDRPWATQHKTRILQKWQAVIRCSIPCVKHCGNRLWC